jgi:integrase
LLEWEVEGRPTTVLPPANEITITELLAAYWKFAETHYRKNGEPTGELNNVRHALIPLRALYGDTAVRDFGPLALKALQREMIRQNLSRRVINSRIGKIKRVFRWSVSEQLAPPSLCHALATVMGLQQGRTEARETQPVRPVENHVVDASIPYLPPIVADMVRFQRLTGCRPSEVCLLRPCDLDRSGDVWSYRPALHKNEHHGKERVIFVGPQAQQILLRYLLRDAQVYCFSPEESEQARKAELRAKRKSKVQPSQIDRSRRNAKRKPNEKYTRTSYLWAARRACDKAFPAPTGLDPVALKAWRKQNWWSPNQLRHAAGTEIRRRYGLEAAQVVLGHSKADTTQVYAERDFAKAEQVMKEVG